MQYTVRNIPAEVDRAAREQAEREGLSLNDVLLRALRGAFGVVEEPSVKRLLPPSFDGTPLEPGVIETLEQQRWVDPSEWE